MYINAVSIYRLSRRARNSHLGWLSRVFDALNLVLFSAVIPASALIGEETICEHRGIGVVIHPEAEIGEHCRILPHVVVGGREGLRGAPKIGRYVLLGTGCKVLGPISVGDGAKIGANAVVLRSVIPGDRVGGVPSSSLKRSGGPELQAGGA